jgi:hypothetical protein
MEITTYKSDSGSRDFEEKSFSKDIPFTEILKKAFELKAPLISKTSYFSPQKPGAWYIKGYKNNSSYDEIKTIIEDNVKNNKFQKRICYLIKYPLN